MTYIQIGEKDYPFRVTYTVLVRIGKMTGFTKLQDVEKAFASVTMEQLPKVIKLCVDAGAKAAGEDERISEAEIRAALDEDLGLLQRFSDAMAEDMGAAGNKDAVAAEKN